MELGAVSLAIELAGVGNLISLCDGGQSLGIRLLLIDFDLQGLAAIRCQVGEDPEVGLRLGQLDIELANGLPFEGEFHPSLGRPVRTGR